MILLGKYGQTRKTDSIRRFVDKVLGEEKKNADYLPSGRSA